MTEVFVQNRGEEDLTPEGCLFDPVDFNNPAPHLRLHEDSFRPPEEDLARACQRKLGEATDALISAVAAGKDVDTSVILTQGDAKEIFMAAKDAATARSEGCSNCFRGLIEDVSTESPELELPLGCIFAQRLMGPLELSFSLGAYGKVITSQATDMPFIKELNAMASVTGRWILPKHSNRVAVNPQLKGIVVDHILDVTSSSGLELLPRQTQMVV